MAPALPSALESELALHLAWTRRLARHLVRDAGAADDIAQEAALALISRPQKDGPVSRAWLSLVVRRLAWKRQRDARPELEIEAAEPRSSSSARDALERLETQRILLEELACLREPLRSTILARYFDGRSAASIARRERIPAATVRSRLQQGLAELRLRLDRRFGGAREAWCTALAPLVRGTPLDWPADLVSLGLAMSTTAKILAGTAALALAGILYIAKESLRSTGGAPLALPQPGSATALVPEPERERDAELDVARERVTAADERSAVASPESAAIPSTTSILGRVMEENGQPIGDAWIARYPELSPRTDSAPGGDLLLELADFPFDKATVGLCVGAPGHATIYPRVEVVRGATNWLGDVVLSAGGAIEGRVLTPAGEPIAGARVLAAAPSRDPYSSRFDRAWMRVRGPALKNDFGSLEFGVPETRSAVDGSYHIDGVELGSKRLWASSLERWGSSELLQVCARETTRGIDVIVAARLANDPPPIEGIVLLPDGTPYAHVGIRANVRMRGSEDELEGYFDLQADGDGRFRIEPVRNLPHDLVASDGDGSFYGEELRGVLPGARGVVIQLRAPKDLSVVARGSDGSTPRISLLLYDPGAEGYSGGGVAVASAPNRVLARVPEVPFEVFVEAPGYAPAHFGPFDLATVPAEIEVELARLAGIRGRVVHAGAPFVGATIELFGSARGLRVFVNGFPSAVLIGALATTTSAAGGEFELPIPKDGRYLVRASAGGFAPSECAPFDAEALRGASGIEVELSMGGAIEGTVRTAEGRSPAGIVVEALHGSAQSFEVTVGPDGRFRFEGLTPGPWQVQRGKVESAWVAWQHEGDGDAEIPWNCEVAAGATTGFELDLSEERPCVVVAEITLNGAPAAGFTLQLLSMSPSVLPPPEGSTDERGRARIDLAEPGPYVLCVQPPAELGATGGAGVCRVDLVAGENPWRADLESGSLEGQVVGWDPAEELEVSYRAGSVDASFSTNAPVTVDAAGRFALGFVPAGNGELVARAPAASDASADRVLARVVVRVGETAHVTAR